MRGLKRNFGMKKKGDIIALTLYMYTPLEGKSFANTCMLSLIMALLNCVGKAYQPRHKTCGISED